MRRTVRLGAAIAAIYLVAVAAAGLLATPGPADLIVVLGNEVLPGGAASPRLRARLDAALDAWRAGLATRVMVSGSVAPDGQDEAAVMAAYLQANGAPAAAIVQDPHGVDTWATARNAAALLDGQGRVLAATQWFHVPRTLMALRRFGLTGAGGAWPRFAEARDAYSLLREAAALPWYAVRPLPVGNAGRG